MNNEINEKELIKKDIEKYTQEIQKIQKELDTIAAKKEELLKIGYRLEGIIAYLNGKLNELEKDNVVAQEPVEVSNV